MDVAINNVSVTYGSVTALRDVTLSLGPGRTVLLGANGAGKSTLMRLTAGLERPSSGDVTWQGHRLATQERRRAWFAQSNYMPQSSRAPRNQRCIDYLRYGAWLKGSGWSEAETSAKSALARCDLGAVERRRIRTLSGGTLRRLMIAQALVNQPSALLLDEPTVGLDPGQRHSLQQLIKGLTVDDGTGASVLVSTHLMEDALSLAQRVLVLNAGMLKFDGTLTEFLSRGSGRDELSRATSAWQRLVGC